MSQLFLIIAALLGATVVMLGAFAAHGLRGRLPENLFKTNQLTVVSCQRLPVAGRGCII